MTNIQKPTRQIKFRAWDKKRKKFIPIAKINTDIDNSTLTGIRQSWSGKNLSRNEVELIQFIGLQDKNGKDIYEGYEIKNEQGHIETVGMMTGLGCYPFIQFPEYKCWDHDECEIIGNIYENLELLK